MADEKESMILDNVLESLAELGYNGTLSDKVELKSAIDKGLGSNAFINVIDLVCAEMKVLMELDESVTCPSGPQDADSFNLEMRSFVSEIGCPHKALVQDLMALNEYHNRLLLLDFLTSQLMAARLIYLQRQKKKQELPDDNATMVMEGRLHARGQLNLVKSNPYSVAGNLTSILQIYGIAKPPSHVTVKMLFDKIIQKTDQLISEAPKGHITQSLVTQGLTQDQWGTLDEINKALTEEYSLRRRMLLTRCNVTVKSFKWSDKAKNKEDEFTAVYQERLATMKERAPVLIARVLATKKDILAIERTSYGAVRRNTQCEVNKVLMGKVPDRGGRPNETRPPPEMPSFKKRTEPSPQEKRERGGYKGGGARGKRGGGGRVQGGWSSGGGSGYQGDWGGGGGYQGNSDSGGQQQGGYGGGYQQGGRGHQGGGYDGYGRGGGGGRGGGRGGQYQRQNSGQYYYS